MVFDAGLVAVIVDGTAVAERAGCVDDNGLRGHRRAECAREATVCVFDDRERVGCLRDISLNIRDGIGFVGVDTDEGSVLFCREFGV